MSPLNFAGIDYPDNTTRTDDFLILLLKKRLNQLQYGIGFNYRVGTNRYKKVAVADVYSGIERIGLAPVILVNNGEPVVRRIL